MLHNYTEPEDIPAGMVSAAANEQIARLNDAALENVETEVAAYKRKSAVGALLAAHVRVLRVESAVLVLAA